MDNPRCSTCDNFKQCSTVQGFCVKNVPVISYSDVLKSTRNNFPFVHLLDYCAEHSDIIKGVSSVKN